MKRLIQYFDSVGKIAGALATVVALISGGIALYYVLRPPPPAKGEAKFLADELSKYGPPFRLRDYLKIARLSTNGYSEHELDTPGVYFTVLVRREGLRNLDTPLFWTVYRGADSVPVGGFVRQKAALARAPRNDFTCGVGIWIPLPQMRGTYFAVIEIDHGDLWLDQVQTPSFGGYAAYGGNPTPAPPPTTTVVTTTMTTTTEPITTTTAGTTSTDATTAPSTTAPTTTAETVPITTNQPASTTAIIPPNPPMVRLPAITLKD